MARIPWRSPIVPVALVGLALAVILPSLSIRASHQRIAATVQANADALNTALQLRLTLIENQVSAVAAFLSGSHHVDATAFAAFIERSGTDPLRQSLRAVAFMPALSQNELEKLPRYLDAHSAD